jgi:predicted PurR-regulated permease PerM
VIFALLAGGSVMGFIGILVAIPVAATIGVLVRFMIAKYMDSEFYLERK